MEKADTIDEHVIKANHRIVIDICERLIVDDDEDDLLKLKNLLRDEIKKGLSKRTNDTANIKCFPTFIQQLPRGCEKGKFLTIHVDGLKFRIILIHLLGMDDSKIDMEQFEMPHSMMTADGETFFDYIATAFYKFVYKYELEYDQLNIGLLFDFPLRIISLTKGILINWDKGFSCSGVEGNDVVELLSEAIKRKSNFHINLITIVTETTSTLIKGAWAEPSTKIGVIIDNNTNACYLEQTKHIELFKDDIQSSKVMLINTEWGNFGDNGVLNFIQRRYDKVIDAQSENPGERTFEKMIAGKYMGEIARLIIMDCIQAGALFEGEINEEMSTPYRFSTTNLIEIINEEPTNYVTAKYIFQRMGYKSINESDLINVHYICTQVTYRAAKLLAAAVACLIDYIGDPFITIAWNGYICHSLPLYIEKMSETLKVLVRPEHKYENIIIKDGAHGSAIMAAIIAESRKRQHNKLQWNTYLD